MTPELNAYKQELRQVGLTLRLAGMAIVLMGAALLVAARFAVMPSLMVPGFAMLGLGWGLWGYTVMLRTQWAKANPYKGPR